jgi:hypothetical protein
MRHLAPDLGQRRHVGLRHPDVGEDHVEGRLADGGERGHVGVGLDDVPTGVTQRQPEHEPESGSVVAHEDAGHER